MSLKLKSKLFQPGASIAESNNNGFEDEVSFKTSVQPAKKTKPVFSEKSNERKRILESQGEFVDQLLMKELYEDFDSDDESGSEEDDSDEDQELDPDFQKNDTKYNDFRRRESPKDHSDESEDHSDDENEEGSDVEDADDEKKNDTTKLVDENQKAEAKKSRQCTRWKLELNCRQFEVRILMQNVLKGIQSLPNGPLKPGKEGEAASAAVQKCMQLLSAQIHMQDNVLASIPSAKYILDPNATKPRKSIDPMDEEITSSEDEEEVFLKSKQKKTEERVKRKFVSTEAIEDFLSKRHKAMKSFRDDTVKHWEQRTRVIRAARGTKQANDFSAFEERFASSYKRAVQGLEKEKFVCQSQLRSENRDNLKSRIGECIEREEEWHDPEIYDDRPFYSRLFQTMLSEMRGSSRANFYESAQKLKDENKKKIIRPRERLTVHLVDQKIVNLIPKGARSILTEEHRENMFKTVMNVGSVQIQD